MPELPDIAAYIDALERRLVGARLEGVRLASPFLLRSIDPPIGALTGKRLRGMRRLGKQIVFDFEDDLFLVLHLMIAGRLQWKDTGARLPAKAGLAAFDFSSGTLILTEAGSKRRAAVHVIHGESRLKAFDRGGLDVLSATLDAFAHVLARENHTLKRSLTDPRLLDGIGNAYSDEILHRARLSPLKLTARLSETETERLYRAARETLTEWMDRLRSEAASAFPTKVTAFRRGMAVHGRYGKPCPVCGAPVQRIVYAENECNYCAECQTGGKLLADRALSRLLKEDWPRSIDAMERHLEQRR